MDGGIDHDSAVDVDLDDLSLLLVVCHSLVAGVVDALQSDKFLTALDKLGSEFVLILVVLEGIAVEAGDLACSLETLNIAIHGSCRRSVFGEEK